MFTEQLKERDSIAGTPVHSANYTGLQSTGTVDLSKFHRVQFIFDIGVVGAAATVQCYLQQGNNSNASDATNIAGSATTTNVAVNNQVVTIEAYYGTPEFTGRYVRGQVNIQGAAGAQLAIIPIGTDARFKPAFGNDDASVNTRIAF